MSVKKARTPVPIIDEIAGRWSTRSFAGRPVEDEKLLRLFEAARWAPSSRNEQPWRFLVARKTDGHYARLFEGINEHNQQWAWTAPVIGVSLAKVKMDYKGRENSYRIHDVGLAMGNFLAQATFEGLYVHPMAGIEPEKILRNFDIDPGEYEVVAMFALGYRDENRLDELDEKYREMEQKPRSRRNLSELVFGDGLYKKPEWLR